MLQTIVLHVNLGSSTIVESLKFLMANLKKIEEEN